MVAVARQAGYLVFRNRPGLGAREQNPHPEYVVVRRAEITVVIDGRHNGAVIRLSRSAQELFVEDTAHQVLAKIVAEDRAADRDRRALELVKLIALTAEDAGATAWGELHAKASALAKELLE